jgi:hypothetical protein
MMQRRKEHESMEFWSAVAKRSGDTAFALSKRRGASLPAAV